MHQQAQQMHQLQCTMDELALQSSRLVPLYKRSCLSTLHHHQSTPALSWSSVMSSSPSFLPDHNQNTVSFRPPPEYASDPITTMVFPPVNKNTSRIALPQATTQKSTNQRHLLEKMKKKKRLPLVEARPRWVSARNERKT